VDCFSGRATTLGDVDATVAIVSHGNRELAMGCLAALTTEVERKHRVEVIVLDNASEDGSAAALRSSFPAIRLVARATRAGFGSNHNAIAALAKGRHIFMLNDDTIVGPGTIDALVDFLDSNPQVAVAAPLIRSGDREPYTFVLRFPSLMRAVAAALWPWSPLERWNGRQPRQVDWVNGCAMMVRRSAFGQVGGFDEGFFMYAEEKDLCKRLADVGWQVFLVPGGDVVHFGESSTEEVPARRATEFRRSQRYYNRKHLGTRTASIIRALAALESLQLWLGAAVLSRLPRTIRPGRVRPEAAAEYRHQLAGALSGQQEPGLRELAQEWNRRAGEPGSSGERDAR
jgi:N-acetylglucosaminyl-diphospho-decaprenol L-rhamnosyltransferase